MSKGALIEIGMGAAAIAAGIFIPGLGAAVATELISAGASMAAGGVISGIASLTPTGGVSGAMRNPIGAHNYQFGRCSVSGTTVFQTANNNTGGGQLQTISSFTSFGC